MLRFLLDTNVLSEPVRPRPDPRVLRKIREFDGEMATAAPAWHELLFGLCRLPHSQRRQRFEHYAREILEPTIPILPYDTKAADWHAAERARLSGIGQTPAFVDGQIAAVARIRDLVLVTHNVKDFVGFEGLVVEDWSSEAHESASAEEP
jgi:tRNA(fMet)-specific endonuclease VapC